MLWLGCASTRPKADETALPPAPIDTTFARAVSTTAQSGMVVCAHPLAASAGRKVLQSGGNAADAALAALATLSVVEPHASGLGGGGFFLYYDAAQDSFFLLDYREKSPRRMNRSQYFLPEDTLKLVQRTGGASILVPGAAAGWRELHSRFGTKRLPELFADAIAIADTGYQISEKQSAIILEHAAEFLTDSLLSSIFLDQGLPPSEGFRIRLPELSKLLKFLSNTRLDNFYFAPVASDVMAAARTHGGSLDDRDLASYAPVSRAPLRITYRDYEIITAAPPAAGGITLLEILKLLEAEDIRSMGLLTPEYIHEVATAIRQARTDANTWMGDPDFVQIPADTLLSDSYIEQVYNSLSSDSVPQAMLPLDSLRAFGPGNTTHLVVADSAGNVVTLTQSINYFFGSGVMVPEWQLLLNNHMADFSSDTTSVNGLRPNRRPVSSMAPTMVFKNGKPVLALGSPGGPRIPAALVEVLLAVLEFDVPLDEAQNLPRFFPAGQNLVVETRLPEATLEALKAKGWRIAPNEHLSNYFGGVQAIQFDEGGALVGCSDPRRDGAADGY